MTATHAFEDHTAEVRVRLRAPTLPDLFAEAGKALAELESETVPPPVGPEESIAVEAIDRDALLVTWIDELIYRGEKSGRIYTRFAFDRFTERALEARIAGAPLERPKTAVKAATFHGLRIDEGPDGFSAAVVLDV